MTDSAARRLVVASAVRLHVAQRLGTEVLDDEPRAAAARLAGTADLERRYALAFSPAYPGTSAGRDAGGARLVLACRVHHRGELVATVLTTLVRGRAPLVTAAPPEVAPEPGGRPVPRCS